MTHEHEPASPDSDLSLWLDLQARAHAAFEIRLDAVVDWTAPTPDTEWDTRALVLHVVREQQRAHTLLSGGDESPIRLLCEVNLAVAGIEVLQAADGEEALALVRSEEPDLVLLDLMMPGMDGYEATRAIREMPDVGGLPIIVVTAKAMPGDRERAISCGASDYITKPVDTDQLLALMGIWLYPATEPPGAFALDG